MKVQLRYFASIREALGTGSESLDTQSVTLAALRAELVARGGAYAEALAPGRAVRVALNQTMSDETAALIEGAEVGFFPPVTGG
jgi:molybdopterin synthase sulfur carrier subunit